MFEQDYATFWRELITLYSRQAYGQALALLQHYPHPFPQPGLMYHWKMCLAARAHDPDLALLALKEALAAGYSYPAAFIREDDDLASLQEIPAYQELAALSLRRFAAVQTQTTPELLLLPPAQMGVAQLPLLLALHGDWQNARLAASNWQPMAAHGWLLACAQSSERVIADAYIWNDLNRGTSDVAHLYHVLNTRNAIDPDHVVLGGFGVAGGLAIYLAVTGAIKARGFLVVGPSRCDLELLKPYLDTAAMRGLRGYIVTGLQVPTEGQVLVRNIHAFFNTHGIPCDLEEYPEIAHTFPADFAHSIEKALAFLQLQ